MQEWQVGFDEKDNDLHITELRHQKFHNGRDSLGVTLNDGLKKTTVMHRKGNWRCDGVAFDTNDIVEHLNLTFKGNPDVTQNRTKLETHVDPFHG